MFGIHINLIFLIFCCAHGLQTENNCTKLEFDLIQSDVENLFRALDEHKSESELENILNKLENVGNEFCIDVESTSELNKRAQCVVNFFK